MPLKKDKSDISTNISYLAICILLINPITLFILTDKVFIAILIPILLISIFFIIRKFIKASRLTIYYFNILFLLSLAYHSELIFTTNYKEYNIPNLYEIKGPIYFNKPFLYQVLDDGEYISEYITNAQGYRISSSNDPNNEVHQCDWLFIGDSYTQGAQVDYEELFTTHLYKEFPDKIIINAGISGYGIVDYYNYYINEGYKLKPDKVFLQVCVFNDFMKVVPTKVGIPEHLMEISNLYRYLKYNLVYETPSELPLKRWTEPFYMDENDNKAYNIFYIKSSEKKDKDLKEFKKYIKKLNDKVVQNGSELIVILIPTKEQINYKYFEEVISSFKIDVSNLNMNLPNELMKDLSMENDFTLIDYYLPFINSHENVFFEKDEHLNEDGHKVVSNEIKRYFQEESSMYNYLSNDNNNSRYPNYYDNGQKIVYQGSHKGNFQIFNSDTSFNSPELLNASDIDKIHPTISMNGKYLAYTQGNQETSRTKIVIQDLITKQEYVVTELDHEYGAIPHFSNSSNYLVYPGWYYDSEAFTSPSIFLYNFETKEKSQLTNDNKEYWRPIFHPNDSIIYFISRSSNEEFNIESLNIFNGQRKTVLNTSYNIWDPCISKDGKYISFAGFKNNNWDLFLLNIYTKEVTQLTKTLGNEWDPSFSMNSNHLIFAGTFGLNNGIYKIELKR